MDCGYRMPGCGQYEQRAHTYHVLEISKLSIVNTSPINHYVIEFAACV